MKEIILQKDFGRVRVTVLRSVLIGESNRIVSPKPVVTHMAW